MYCGFSEETLKGQSRTLPDFLSAGSKGSTLQDKPDPSGSHWQEQESHPVCPTFLEKYLCQPTKYLSVSSFFAM